MIIRKTDEIEKKVVEMEGAEGVSVRWLLSESNGAPTFAMREFTVKVNGNTPYHRHKWEHEVFILSGEGTVISESGETPLSAGSVILTDGNEYHSFRNTGIGDLKFLCMIPNYGK